MARTVDEGGGVVREAPAALAGSAFAMLADLVADGGVVVLSGAGLSTESGIPDYRGETGRRRRATPMTYQTFTGSAVARRRYWARSHLGWRHITAAAPNAGHGAVAALQRRGLVSGIITQNVDGLHQAAGADDVIELHGSLDRVICLGCGRRTPRLELHERLHAANPAWRASAAVINPDGDAVLGDEEIASFRVVDCLDCGGVLKPDVVFFGENVPKARVETCYSLTERAGLLLVLGSSLTVLSGFRFVRHAARLAVPVAIINQGPTRGDGHALLTFDAPLGPTLTALLAGLDRISPSPRAAPRRLREEHAVDGWWAQSVTVAYEQARGRRVPGQRSDGSFSVSAGKTVAVPVDRLYAAFADPDVRDRWLPAGVRVRTATPPRTFRADWTDGSTRIAVGFAAKGEATAQVSLAHEKIADAERATAMKAYWRERLEALKALLEG